MNFTVPRENLSKMVMYVWKIIDFPQISKSDLIFKLSFELFLFTPNEAEKFIDNAIKAHLLDREPNNSLRLSNTLEKQLLVWQQKRITQITKKEKELKSQYQVRTDFLEESRNHFNILLKALMDKGTINRAATISEDAFNITTFNPDQPKIVATVKGSKEIPYNIIIDIDNKIINHNCHDFQTKQAKNYKFCKHLAKLFLILKKKNEDWANLVLEKITTNIEEWTFLP